MKIGVIGLGSIGMRHAKNLFDLGHKPTCWDPDPAKRAMIEGRISTTSKRENVFQDVEAIVIASPTTDHYGDICSCYHAKKPSLVEKPIANMPINGWGPASCISMVGYNLRFHSCVRKAKEWIDAGRIGKPLWANFCVAQFNAKSAYLRDGVILNWSHEIDLALHLLGPGYVEASSTRIVDGHDDMTDILLTHESGCRSTIHLDYVTKPEHRYFIVAGESGRITGDLPRRNLFFYKNEDDQCDWHHDKGSYDQDYIDEIKAFVDRIEGKQAPGCTGEEALKVLEICLEVRRQAGL